ncbi:MAG: helical backbone metal receptor [Eubacteriales bacterium]|nr:helical backbone metal receptor [Eubacteriales bacterium]
MRKFKTTLFTLGLAAVLAFGLSGCGKEEAKDNTKTEEKADGEKKVDNAEKKADEKKTDLKVVAGTVAIANILDKLEYDHVVGVPETKYELPARYKDAKPVGQPMKPDAEVVKSLAPDLFISTSSLAANNKPAMDELHVDSLFVELNSLEQVTKTIRSIGEKLGIEDKAASVADDLEKQAQAAKEKVKDETPKTALFLFGTPKSVMVGNKNTYVGSLMTEMNIKNIFADNEEPFAPLSLEDVVAANPDFVLVMNHVNPEESKAMMQKQFDENPAWTSLDAYKNDRIIYLDNDLFSVTGNIHVADAMNNLAKTIYEK